MIARNKWSRILVIVGLVAMVVSAVDPLEGSIVILAALGLVVIGELLTRSRHRLALYWSFVLVLSGVAAMWVMSAMGGVGGNTGRSLWWTLVLIPYPVGWLCGLIFTVRRLREGFA